MKTAKKVKAAKSKVEPGTRSGTSRTYAERRDAGRPNRTFSLAADLDELISTLAKARQISRSAVVDLAVRELASAAAVLSGAPVKKSTAA